MPAQPDFPVSPALIRPKGDNASARTGSCLRLAAPSFAAGGASLLQAESADAQRLKGVEARLEPRAGLFGGPIFGSPLAFFVWVKQRRALFPGSPLQDSGSNQSR